MSKVNSSISGAVRTFSFWLVNRTLERPVLQHTDYARIFDEPSAMEQAYAIFMNNLELDDTGEVSNTDHAARRAAQYIRNYIDGPQYTIEPPLEEWEIELH